MSGKLPTVLDTGDGRRHVVRESAPQRGIYGESSAMSSRALALGLTFLALGALSGCGGFSLRPVTPMSAPGSALASGSIANVEVNYNVELEADKTAMLDRYGVPGAMQQVLVGLGNGAPTYTVRIDIMAFRNGFGPALMRATVYLNDGSGQNLRTFEVSSTTIRGGNKPGRLSIIAQDIVQQIADGL